MGTPALWRRAHRTETEARAPASMSGAGLFAGRRAMAVPIHCPGAEHVEAVLRSIRRRPASAFQAFPALLSSFKSRVRTQWGQPSLVTALAWPLAREPPSYAAVNRRSTQPRVLLFLWDAPTKGHAQRRLKGKFHASHEVFISDNPRATIFLSLSLPQHIYIHAHRDTYIQFYIASLPRNH